MKAISWMFVVICCMALAPAALAVDGVAVTAHYRLNGPCDIMICGFGEILRLDVAGDQVVDTVQLYAGPAREPAISGDGTQVAFLKEDGMLAMVPLLGGEVRDLVQAHAAGHIEWSGPWIYYSLGYPFSDESRTWRRYNTLTGKDEFFVRFEPCGTWRFHISLDGKRATIRGANGCPPTFGCHIYAYDMELNNGLLDIGRATDDPCSCGSAASPSGSTLIDGNDPHTGWDVRDWETMKIIGHINIAETDSWSPGGQSGPHENRNKWSRNHEDWFCAHLGWGEDLGNAGNVVLLNWRERRKVVLSHNQENSYEWHSCGGFYVHDNQPPRVVHQPEDVTAPAGSQAELWVSVTGLPPFRYQWQRDGQDIAGQTSPLLRLPMTDADDGARIRCVVTNDHGTATSEEARLTVSGPLPEGGVWHSHEVTVSSAHPGGSVTSPNGVDAQVLFYAGGLAAGTPFTEYTPGGHPEPFNQVSGFWSYGGMEPYPYVGKSTTGRGTSAGESNAPPPAGVSDLALHVPLDGSSAVVAFEAPASGSYRVTLLAGRRISDDGDTVRLQLGGPGGQVLKSLTLHNDQAWAVHAGPVELGTLRAGDRIAFGVDADGEPYWDAVEMAWRIEQAASPANTAPNVNLGADRTVAQGQALVIVPTVSDDGLPGGSLTYVWSQTSGPGTAQFSASDQERTSVSFDKNGAYILRLTVSDGELDAFDEIQVNVGQEVGIELESPNGGEVWEVGTTRHIRFSAVGVTDVTLRYSTDNGHTWTMLEQTLDQSSPDWENYPWVVPDEPSTLCRVRVEGYFGEGTVTSAAPFTIKRPGESSAMEGSGCGCRSLDSPGWPWLAGLMLLLLARRR